MIIDGDPLIKQRLKNLLIELSDIKIVGDCSTGREAVIQIEEVTPDLIFLNVDLVDISGFEVLEKLTTHKKPLVIFVTEHSNYALKAFDYFVFDYLLKPFKDDRFFRSVSKAIELIKQNSHFHFEERLNYLLEHIEKPLDNDQKDNYRQTIPIKKGNKTIFIDINNIRYIIASGYHVEIYTEDKRYVLRDSLTNLITELDPKIFARVHRSTIINLNFMEELLTSNFGEMDVKMKDKRLFRISKGFKKMFLMNIGVLEQ